MADISETTSRSLRKRISSGCLYVFTSLGVVCAFFSLEALYRGEPRVAINWLFVSLVIDGVDGPIARALKLDQEKQMLDGDVLDLVVDYLTFILIPALLLYHLNLFPSSIEVIMTLALLMVGALWSARPRMKTKDNWFNGFLAAWNFLAISIYLLDTHPWFNAAVMIVFMVLCATDVKFFHIFRSQQLRPLTLLFTGVYLLTMVYMVNVEDQLHNRAGQIIICLWFAYYLAMAFWRTWIYEKHSLGLTLRARNNASPAITQD